MADYGPEFDAVLLGYVILEDPGVDDVTADWLASPLWQEALRILRGAQRRGQRLGDLITAGRVLGRGHDDLWPLPHTGGSGIAFPLTLAAVAVCAAYEVPLAAVIRQARERVVQLALTRLGRLLPLYADLEPAALYAALPTLRARLDAIEATAERYGVPIDRPAPAGPSRADDDNSSDDDAAVRIAIW